jgi:CP family cyanate transporter-like MFS transporter
MGGQSLLFYGTLAWLAAAYTSRGYSASYAGLLLAVFSATQVITAFAIPALAHRGGDARPWIVASVGATTLGLALVAFVPDRFPSAPWTWASLLGLGMGGNLALALLVLTQNAPTPEAAPAFTGMAFFVGYLMAAAGPVAAGAVRDATGGHSAVFAALAVLGVLTLLVGVAAPVRR